MASKISLFGGTGFIGGKWGRSTNRPFLSMPRDFHAPETAESLYFISTTDNYNVFSDPLLDVNTNLVRLMQTLSYHRPGSVFNFISSWFVYGETTGQAAEIHPCNPKGLYSITKRAAEQLLISYCETKGIKWRIFRLSNIYGPDAPYSEKKNALQHMVSELAAGRDIELYWGGISFRDYLHVSDCVRAIDICMDKAPHNSITNIGYGSSKRMDEIFNIVLKELPNPGKVYAKKPPAFHTQVQARSFFMDTRKLQSYGFTPKINITEGIKECCRLMSPQIK